VVSNKFTRDLQIDGMDIFDIRLAQVMTGGENSTHYSGADLNSTLTHMTKNMFPGQDPYLWDNRYTAIKELAKELAKVVAQKGSRSVIPASPAHTPPPKGATEGPVRSLEDFWNARPTDAVPEDFEMADEHEGNDDLATLAGSPEFRPEDYDEADPVEPLDTVQQFERTTQARFLEECKLDNFKVNTINNWVSQRVGKDKMAQVRLAGSELAAAIERLPAGNRPAVDAIAVQWGLPVNAAAKINERSLYQLIATRYVLGNFYQGICVVLHQVYRSNLNAPWVGVMLSKLRLHEKKFPVFGTKVGKRFIRRVQCKCRMYLPTIQASSIVEGHVMCAARDIAPTSCLAKDLDSLTFQVDHKAGPPDRQEIAAQHCQVFKPEPSVSSDMPDQFA
ncbi:unnamed protein product, partial [Symbiodinium necroappetens]